MFSMDTEEEARNLIVLTCGTTLNGDHYAKELVENQTLENLKAFSDRLEKAYQWLKEREAERGRGKKCPSNRPSRHRRGAR